MATRRRVQVIVCTGADCRRSKGHGELVDLVATVRGSSTIPCQGICDGPIVGVGRHDKIRWYKRIRGRRRRALARVLRTGRGRKALLSAEARKRRGTIRHLRRLRPIHRAARG
ncbi:MAG: hypothetical protein ABIQ73_03810 [Acidimicrobiales bacterium]